MLFEPEGVKAVARFKEKAASGEPEAA